MKIDIYICYNRKDIQIVETIRRTVELKTGVGCLMDTTGLEGSGSFSLKTASDIRCCQIFIFILSENSLCDEHALLELKFAYSMAKENGRHMAFVNIGDEELIDKFEHATRNSDFEDWHYKVDRNNLLYDLRKWTGTSKNSDVTVVINNLIANMVPVEGGTFTMGSDDDLEIFNGDAETCPFPHQVTLSSFSIGRYAVTQEEWEAIMDSNRSSMKGHKLPVDRVSWEDCQEFIRRLNTMTGKQFRLPTEAEWEYAARGGNKSRGHRYAGSDCYGEVAWCLQNSGDSLMVGDDRWNMLLNYRKNNCHIHEVGRKMLNELGLYDMNGNVFEWCRDGFYFYPIEAKETLVNPCDVEDEGSHVVRGGCWCSFADDLHVAARKFSDVASGFRLVL